MKRSVRFGLFIEYIFGNTSAKITIKVVINIVAYRIPGTPNKSQRKTVVREDAKIFTRLFDNNNEEINSLEKSNQEINDVVNTNNNQVNSTNSTFIPNEEVITTFQEELLNHLKLADSINFTEARVIDYTLVNNDQGFFLKTLYSNDYASTTALARAEQFLSLQKTTCTSKTCSNSETECQPNGNKCTKCAYGAGDCTRTTTSGGCHSCATNLVYTLHAD